MEYSNALNWVSRHAASGALPAAVLGIGSSRGPLVVEAFGTTGSRATKVDDYFDLFSVTKPIVGLAALRVVERGELDLRTPLTAALPNFGRKRTDIVRLEHLLTHTSGILEERLDPLTPLEVDLVEAGSVFTAGAISQYASLAFSGTAALVEMATGRDIEQHVVDLASSVDAGFTFDGDVGSVPIPDIDEYLDYDRFRTLRHPGAGMFGRASDLLALGADLLRVSQGERGSVHPSTLTSMTTPRTVGLPRLGGYPAEAGQDWGLTFNLRYNAPGLLEKRVFGHAGMSGVEWWIYPTLDLVFVLMTNRVDAALHGILVDTLHNAVVGEHLLEEVQV